MANFLTCNKWPARRVIGVILLLISLALAPQSFAESIAYDNTGFRTIGSVVGILVWGYILFQLLKAPDEAKTCKGIPHSALAILLYFFIVFLMAASHYGALHSVPTDPLQERSFEDALYNPPPFDGKYLNAQEFGMRIGHYLPVVSYLSEAEKLELCLEVAEKHLSDVTTPQQRKQGCSHYAVATKADVLEAMKVLFDFMDNATPSERQTFCESRGPELFGKDVTQEEAALGCSYIAENWSDETKQSIQSQLDQ